MTSRDRRLDELARIEFVGSLTEAFSHYATALQQIATRWDTELGLAAADVRQAMASTRGRWLGLDAPARRVKARRVARRLRRAQTLAAVLGKHARQFPREYQRHFMTIQAANAIQAGDTP